MRRVHASLAWLAALALAACGSDSDGRARPPEGRGFTAPGGGPPAAGPAAGDEDRPDPFGPPEPVTGFEPPGAEAEAQAAAGERAEAGEEQEAERDLSAELRERLGDPSACLDGIDGVPDEVRIDVEATVTGTGVVTRSYVRGGGLPEQALECVRGRLTHARLGGPIPDAPRTVRTTLTLRRERPEDGHEG